MPAQKNASPALWTSPGRASCHRAADRVSRYAGSAGQRNAPCREAGGHRLGGATLPSGFTDSIAAFIADAIDVRRFADHQPAVIDARLHPSDVIAHDEENVGFLPPLGGGRNACMVVTVHNTASAPQIALRWLMTASLTSAAEAQAAASPTDLSLRSM